ncbi:hypothetical protein [Acinetobacter stercoris]|uniref:DUF403 domain-containing protein n=1 Tax=Acinetobacter stercoris TaxID=2126983 RepID=A0A2U3MXJ0_9GAMM|nr:MULTISPECIES: hypothetical protein [Acinetobacter]SPL70121.1 hypothetical protein KPC_1299 [Acinetobacter stercoris]
MILLGSNAEHILWIGRYLTRVQYLCGQFPFVDDESAIQFARSFGIPAYNATSLNEFIMDSRQSISFQQQFNVIKSNIQDLRGLLSKDNCAVLNQHIKHASLQFTHICGVVELCHEVFQKESEDIYLFYRLGVMLEHLDRDIRFGLNCANTLEDMQWIVNSLQIKGWQLDHVWKSLKHYPDQNHYLQFCDHVQYLFEVDV